MLKSLLATAAICGLGTSMFLLSPRNVQADPSQGIRPLSKGEMKSTKGAGSTCNTVVCSGTSGCALGNSTSTTYYPHYQCYSSQLTLGTCSNFGSATCFVFTAWSMPACTGMATPITSATTAICGL